METQIVVSLSRDEALVLFEAIASKAIGQAMSPGTRGVLDSIEAQLERVLVEPFKPDYLQLVQAAERRLVEGDG